MLKENILHGVPKVYYGAFGGITPFPIALKAVSDYLGDELDYTFAIVACGGAFRLAWNVAEWDGGNVDIGHAYEEQEAPFRYGINALGRDFRALWRSGGDKENFKAFIRAQIDCGKPVVSLGPIGPGEAGVITGYRDGGDTLLGWSVFQDWACHTFDEEGYFITDAWWEQGDFRGVMALGEITGPRFDARRVIQNAIPALEGRLEGRHAKGVTAYESWKSALIGAKLDSSQAGEMGMSVDELVMMCQGDATDCLIDGRGHAKLYFERLARENPAQPLYADIAAQFGVIEAVIRGKIYAALGGYTRGPKQTNALAQPETRAKIAGYIDEMRSADERALALMKELLAAM